MKNNICLSLIVLFGIVNQKMNAQVFNYLAEINAKVATIPFVFEGQVQSVEIFAGDDHGNKLPNSAAVWSGNVGYFYDQAGHEAKGYSLARIKVCKVYKGERLDGGTVFDVLTKSFTLDNVYLLATGSGADADTSIHFLNTPPSHDEAGQFDFILPHVSYPKKLYFADKLEPVSPALYAGRHFYSNFHTLYELPFNIPANVPQPDGSYKRINAYCALIPYVFDDQNQLQLFLNQINTINPNPPDFCRDGALLPEVSVEDGTVDNTETIRNYFQWQKTAQERVEISQQNSSGNKSSANEDLTLDIRDERVVQIGITNWFEFDIYVSANTSSIYFDQASMRISYNTAAFGSSVILNGNFVVTPATAFNIPSYYNVSADISGNVIGLAMAPNTSSTITLNRVPLSTSVQKLFTVRIKIQTCYIPVSITFTDQSITENICYFATTPNQSIFTTLNYANVFYNGNITDNSCQPIITNWTNNVPAGINQNVTITGKYFGAYKGSGSVIFRNADAGNRYPIFQGTNSGGIQAYDVVSWDHKQIVLTLPNVIDSAYFLSGSGTATVVKGPAEVYPGTGKFKVVNYAMGVAESNGVITIPYSVKQWVDRGNPQFGYKVHAKIIDKNGGGYRILINNRINNAWADAKFVIQKGMRDWSCATGINWFIGGDTTVKYATDDFCVIDTANLSSLMQTIFSIRTCTTGSKVEYFMRSFDIKVRQNVAPYIWNRDTTGNIPNQDYDFWSAISHELGHGHQLGHINDSLIDLMWWQANPFGYSWLTRKLVKGSPEAVTAGNWVTDSLLGNMSCAGQMILVYPSNCEDIDTRLKKNSKNPVDISVYPNPSHTDENIKIKFTTEKENDVDLSIYDMTGKQILNEKILKTRNVEYDLKTEDLDAGIYLLQLNIGGNRHSFKILKHK